MGQLKHFEIVFDKTGNTVVILDSSAPGAGQGYRVTLWAFDKQQNLNTLCQDDLDSET